MLAKISANRLKKAVGKVVPSPQNAFVEGRQILDVALIANEVIDSLLKRNENSVLCMLDLKKTYDYINWNFLLLVMQKIGFKEKWASWIRWCISTMTFAILVNGTPSSFVHNTRELRQRDPLSPYLFVIVMEVLSSLINRAMSGGFFSSCRVKEKCRDGARITHLLFIDDTFVVCKAS